MSPELFGALGAAALYAFGYASYRKHKRIIAEKKKALSEKKIKN